MTLRALLRRFIATTLMLAYASTQAASPPAQPTSGPGSNNYVHGSYKKTSYGSGDLKYWIYEPAAPEPTSAPVILYLHGWSADRPSLYEDLLIHYARNGHVVIFPKIGSWLNIHTYEANSKQAYQNALAKLQAGGHVAPNLDKTIIMGHSLGSQIAVKMADTAADFSYPAPKGLVLHEPAGSDQMRNDFMLNNNLGNIPPSTAMLILVRDDWDQDTGAYPVPVTIWHSSPQLKNRGLMSIKSDNHGNPNLQSTHTSVQSKKGNFWDPEQYTDAIDWYGYWRTSDALVDFAFNNSSADTHIFSSSVLDTNMGAWSDGTPVNPMEIISDQTLESIYQTLP